MEHGFTSLFMPNITDRLVVRHLANNTPIKEFYHRYTEAAFHCRYTNAAAPRNGWKQATAVTLSTQEYHTLLRLLGTHHLSIADFHATFVRALEDPNIQAHETRVLFKILGPGFMDIIPTFPFPERVKADILKDQERHCVRCHRSFYVRYNGGTECSWCGGETVRDVMSSSVGGVSFGDRFERCHGSPAKLLGLFLASREQVQSGGIILAREQRPALREPGKKEMFTLTLNVQLLASKEKKAP
ncbi:hypothetical protein M413DRAFT_415324 [Hebeloma cylindrosporum]|uniref:Uncharacterized protein n=1 Tax=Hebeloma cylindrosporum TaxID=76867 RepID=A0A0C3BRU6_HEBCY|nr:hypothetical protein M413DRAFT_415324 [Hebeloma cylindrosporum h7]